VAPPASSTAHSGWAPLSYPDFRRLWTAQFVSNIGTWMQTVAAQWVMLSLTSSATLVASIGAAASLPVLLLGIPAGALGDLIDRKKLIAGSQLLMLLAATGLAGAAAAHALTPALLLALLFLIGCGSAASASTMRQHARLYPSDAAVLTDLDATLRPGETRSVEHSVAVTRSQRTAVAR
jgi:MFS family permease